METPPLRFGLLIHEGRRALSVLVFGALLLVACGDGDREGPAGELVWTRADTVVDLEGGGVGEIGELEVGPDGVLHVVDPMEHRIHRFAADGRRLEALGGEGEGPGELRRPAAVAVAGDSLLVADHDNGRVQALSRDGAYRRSWPLPPRANPAFLDLAPDGRYATGTLGWSDALVALYAPDGELLARFGEPAIEPPDGIRLGDLKRRSAEGEVPDLFRNTAGVHLGPDGFVWLNLTADGAVRKYHRDGTLVFEHRVGDPERSEIFEAFVRKNAEEDGLHPLKYVADFGVVGDELWLLLNREEERPTLFLALGTDGSGLRRIRVPTVRGAGTFAVDRERRRLYLGVPSRAEVVAVAMEER